LRPGVPVYGTWQTFVRWPERALAAKSDVRCTGILGAVAGPNKTERRQLRRLETLVHDVLVAWDPIGGGVPDDEYDCLVWPTIKRLDAGATPEELACWLTSELSGHFGIEATATGTEDTAQRLHDVWASARP
jgi:hypothetical protein